MFSIFKTAKWNDDPNQRLLAQMILRAALYEYTDGKNGEPLNPTKIFQHCSACGWLTKESGNRIVHAASMIKVVAPTDVYRIAKRIAHDLYTNRRPPVDEGGPVKIRQSDWTAIGASAIKRWGITGMLDAGGELQVRIDVSFTRSNISGHLEPHIFIFLHPNTFGNHEGFVTLQVANQEAKLDAPLMTAKIGLADDGSVIVTPMDRSGVEYVVHNVLSSGKSFKILMITPPREVIFRAILPNDSNALSDVISKLPLFDKPPNAPAPKPHARTAKELQFKVNELIVHPVHGVGRVVQIEEQEIAGIKLELYIVDFEKEKLRLKVPTSQSEQKGLRKLTDKPT